MFVTGNGLGSAEHKQEIKTINFILKKRERDLLVMIRFAMMVTATIASRNVSVDLDIVYGSILPGRTVISPAVIRYVKYQTDHTHLRVKQKNTDSSLDFIEKSGDFIINKIFIISMN